MIAPSPTLALTLAPKKSILDGITLGEKVPKSVIKGLIRSGKALATWNSNNYAQQLASQLYDSEVKQLESYCKNFDNASKTILVKYSKAGRCKKSAYGRVFPVQSLGLTTISRKTRNTLIRGRYYDFDLENAQISIISNLCHSNEIPCPQVDYYCEHRNDILKEIQEKYNVSRSCAKKLLLRLCFLGSYDKWMQEYKVANLPKIERIMKFEEELKTIANRSKDANPLLYDTARKSKESKGGKNYLGAFFAMYLQEYELRIVESVMDWLMRETNVMGTCGVKIGTYEYDGIKLLIEYVDRYGKEKMLEDINNMTLQLTGFKMNWTEKEIDDFYDISEHIDRKDDDVMELDGKLVQLINQQKNRFNDAGVVEMLIKYFPGQFIYHVDDKQFYCWNSKLNRWEANECELRCVITYNIPECFHDELNPYKHFLHETDGSENTKLLRKHEAELEHFIKMKCKENSGECSIVGKAKSLLARSDIEFDSNPNLFGCNNGVIDLDAWCFRPYKPTDYVTWTCGYDFRPLLSDLLIIEEVADENGNKVEQERYVQEEDVTQEDYDKLGELKGILDRILPDNDVLNLVMTIFASGLSGKTIEKFFVFNGGGRNGKGLIDGLAQITFGDYFYPLDSLVLQENKKFAKSRDSNPELAGVHKKRLVVCKEPNKTAPLQNSTIRDITGGGSIKGRMNHSNKTNVSLWLKLIMECNEKPNFAEEPEIADAERIVDILFPSHFTNEECLWNNEKQIYPVDPRLKTSEFQLSTRNYFLSSILAYYQPLKDANFVIDKFIPETVKHRGVEYLQNSFDIHKIFTQYFERKSEGDKDEDMTLAKIVGFIRKTKEFAYDLSKAKRSKYDADTVKQFFIENKVYKKDIEASSSNQVFLKGWKLRSLDEDDGDY